MGFRFLLEAQQRGGMGFFLIEKGTLVSGPTNPGA